MAHDPLVTRRQSDRKVETLKSSYPETTSMIDQLARPLGSTAFAALLAFAMPAFASDGVIELNQAKITAAGGYPYTIANPGSYILTSNLSVTGSLDGLIIGTNGVTIDLNGFSISGSGVGCATSHRAIRAANPGQQIVVRNGIINGFCFGISLGTTTNVTVERMNITTSGNQAIATGENAMLRGNIFDGPNSGVNCPSVVVDNSFLNSAGNNAIPTATCAKANLIGNF
jgi:hypothetical protein